MGKSFSMSSDAPVVRVDYGEYRLPVQRDMNPGNQSNAQCNRLLQLKGSRVFPEFAAPKLPIICSNADATPAGNRLSSDVRNFDAFVTSICLDGSAISQDSYMEF
jgi:hypothetical protein